MHPGGRIPSHTNTVRMMAKTNDSTDMMDRRNFLTASSLVSATLAAQLPLNYAFASDDDSFNTFQDDEVGFKVSIPSNWVKSVQSLPDRRKIIFFSDPSTEAGIEQDLIFIAYTSVRDDFTQLSSFGSVEEVAQATVLPKGELAGQESNNNLISAESKRNAYYFDYKTKIPEQPERHFRTIFSLVQGGTGGAGSVLVTLTAQTSESKYNTMKGTFDQVIESFGKK